MRKPNSENLQSKRHQSGNAMIYVLIGIALIGFLTVTMGRQNEQADSQDIDDEMAELYALELIEYANAAKSVLEQMRMTGTTIDEFIFANPTSTPYGTPPHIHKVFHPQGGGLTYKELPENIKYDNSVASPPGWYFKEMDVEWTPSTATDIVFSAYRIKTSVCEKIQEKITGSSDPNSYFGNMYDVFADQSNAAKLDTTFCPSCEGYPSLCLDNNGGISTFYSVLLAR